MTSLDEHFDQLSPLLDDVVSRIGEMKLSPWEIVFMSDQAVMRIVIGICMALVDSEIVGDELSVGERQQLLDMLTENMRKVEEARMAVFDRHGSVLQ
jgi:hypothetical protein